MIKNLFLSLSILFLFRCAEGDGTCCSLEPDGKTISAYIELNDIEIVDYIFLPRDTIRPFEDVSGKIKIGVELEGNFVYPPSHKNRFNNLDIREQSRYSDEKKEQLYKKYSYIYQGDSLYNKSSLTSGIGSVPIITSQGSTIKVFTLSPYDTNHQENSSLNDITEIAFLNTLIDGSNYPAIDTIFSKIDDASNNFSKYVLTCGSKNILFYLYIKPPQTFGFYPVTLRFENEKGEVFLDTATIRYK